MTAAVYVETNFLIGFALGRNEAIDLLMTQPLGGVRILVPAPCLMEALSVLEWSRKEDRRFIEQAFRVRIDA